MSTDAKVRFTAAGFIALLVLALWWPLPAMSVNSVCCHAQLPVDDLSFLGREAPSWDVVFWCIAGIFLIAVLQAFGYEWRDFSRVTKCVRTMRKPWIAPSNIAIAVIAGGAAVFAFWLFLDRPVTALAERFDSPGVEDTIRIFNRLGGGMNPPMIVLFFVIVGVVAQRERWLRMGVAMAIAGLSAGIAAQIVKFAVARTRPELWLGPFVHAARGATSFPSGHTVGSFALAGVLLFGARNLPLQITAFVLACAVGASRILAFRHWGSDVLASALLGLAAAWLAWRSLSEESEGSPVHQ